mmetsp:Transcript_48280/g.127494  ORF Transcript_48280/g.127494 Transcript_48280/m.127494 type:complete len:93 (+) Transcript_48280:502-780(+)
MSLRKFQQSGCCGGILIVNHTSEDVGSQQERCPDTVVHCMGFGCFALPPGQVQVHDSSATWTFAFAASGADSMDRGAHTLDKFVLLFPSGLA